MNSEVINKFNEVSDKNTNKLCYGIVKYCILCDMLDNGITEEEKNFFERLYSGFFGLNLAFKGENQLCMRNKYFDLLFEGGDKSFDNVIGKIYGFTEKYHVSFTSKLIHMSQKNEKGVRDFPIFDRIVGKEHFGFDMSKWKEENKTDSFNNYKKIFNIYKNSFNEYLKEYSGELNKWYNDFINDNDNKETIKKYYSKNKTIKDYSENKDFNSFFDKISKISDTKKADFILWVDKEMKIEIPDEFKDCSR